MTVTLSPKSEAIVRELVETGRYASTDDVIAQALQTLEEQDRLRELRAKLQSGIDQLDRGEGVTFTPEWSASRAQVARDRAAAGEMPSPDVRP